MAITHLDENCLFTHEIEIKVCTEVLPVHAKNSVRVFRPAVVNYILSGTVGH